MSEQPVSYRALIHTFTAFLTVSIHTILFERSIYPATTFISTRKYNYPVRQSRHPRVCKWINDAVAGVETELLRGAAERICVVIFSPAGDDRPLERFVFDVSKFPSGVPSSELDTPLERDGEAAVLPVIDLEEQFRATMSRLSGCGSRLKTIPAGCTYTLAVELRPQAEPPVGHPQPWIPAQPNLQVKAGDFGKGRDVGGAKTTPLRTVAAGEMAFEVWIEEGSTKFNPTIEDEIDDDEGDDQADGKQR